MKSRITRRNVIYITSENVALEHQPQTAIKLSTETDACGKESSRFIVVFELQLAKPENVEHIDHEDTRSHRFAYVQLA